MQVGEKAQFSSPINRSERKGFFMVSTHINPSHNGVQSPLGRYIIFSYPQFYFICVTF